MIFAQRQPANSRVYDIVNNQITSANSLGSVGLDWQLGGFAAGLRPAPSAARTISPLKCTLVQAMAGFGGGSGTGESFNIAPLSADTSQQPLLTTPQHA
jgi:hypothetical protein